MAVRKRVSKAALRLKEAFNPSMASTDELNIGADDESQVGPLRQGRSAVRHDPISTVRRSVSRAEAPEGEGTQEIPSSVAAEKADNEDEEDDDDEGSFEESKGEVDSPPGISGRPAAV